MRVEPASGLLVEDREVVSGAPSSGIYQIGSITKVFTALVLAHEVVGGRLALEQQLQDLPPRLADRPVGSVTLRELVTHTSGLPRLPPGMWRKSVGKERRDPYADIDETSLLSSVADLAPRHPSRPGYSNLGFGLLGHALTRHLGTSYDEAVRAAVTAPLGMHDTGCAPDPERLVVGRSRRGRPHDVAWTFQAMAGAGALWSTVDDMLLFLRAQLDPPGGPLGEAIALSQEPLAGSGRMRRAMAWLQVGGKDGTLLFHNGGTAGYRSFTAVDASRRRAAVVLGASDRSVDRAGMHLVRSG
ncbi:serine hydrolase domain-containing protein [Nocardioides lijunqiniae]|uniref:serine hydrolase domain-containing protein n=1 Tax=Nocardioides lijunqiniae TaxID=2760832 RepID=UPI0018779AE9|nr:serine hydrolase domain-containing protein [Nocardioides lijunqiniae]